MHTLEDAVPVIAAVAFRRHKHDFTRVTCTPYLVVAIGIGHCQACSVPVQHNGRGFNLHGLGARGCLSGTTTNYATDILCKRFMRGFRGTTTTYATDTVSQTGYDGQIYTQNNKLKMAAVATALADMSRSAVRSPVHATRLRTNGEKDGERTNKHTKKKKRNTIVHNQRRWSNIGITLWSNVV